MIQFNRMSSYGQREFGDWTIIEYQQEKYHLARNKKSELEIRLPFDQDGTIISVIGTLLIPIGLDRQTPSVLEGSSGLSSEISKRVIIGYNRYIIDQSVKSDWYWGDTSDAVVLRHREAENFLIFSKISGGWIGILTPNGEGALLA